MAPNGSFVVRESDAEYYPITFMHPLPGNEASVLLDIASIVEFRSALNMSIERGVPASTGPLPITARFNNQVSGKRTQSDDCIM